MTRLKLGFMNNGMRDFEFKADEINLKGYKINFNANFFKEKIEKF